MNQNEMSRYFWRTGQRWSGSDRPLSAPAKGPTGRILFLLVGVFLTTLLMLFLMRPS